MTAPRAIVLMLDSVGIGHAPDAAAFGDAGANTLGHVAAACSAGEADGQRRGPLALPHLSRRGLGLAAAAAAGDPAAIPPGLAHRGPPRGAYGHAVEVSCGKDTPSGHWELAGQPVINPFTTFPATCPCFPSALTEALIQRGQVSGRLGNCHASGTAILERLGETHLQTKAPIVYTSVDSVFQIAAHEDPAVFGLERLYDLCALARELVNDLRVGRVIARPFVGRRAGELRRTPRRRAYAIPPPYPTLLDRVVEGGGEVVAVGKVGDIYAQRSVSRVLRADGNRALFDATLEAVAHLDKGLVFTNFIDFDSLYGHRRDVAGYATALEAFDARWPELEALLLPGDLVVITADHGTDPTWPGTDHTREQVPVLLFGQAVAPHYLGRRGSYADVGQTVARHLGLPPLDHGVSCW
ncbi:MAG: phosphopentomutase [Candidatus Competibacterales bacterium]